MSSTWKIKVGKNSAGVKSSLYQGSGFTRIVQNKLKTQLNRTMQGQPLRKKLNTNPVLEITWLRKRRFNSSGIQNFNFMFQIKE